jgi:hypothetical protein
MHSWKTTLDNTNILKRKLIYDTLFENHLQRSNHLGRDDPRISSKSCQQIPLLEMIMDTELVAIQIILFGIIIFIYMAEEFNK